MARMACSRADSPDLLRRSSAQETLRLDPEKESPNIRPLVETCGRQREGEGNWHDWGQNQDTDSGAGWGQDG